MPAGATAKDMFELIGANYDWNFSSMEAETAGSKLSDLIPEDVYACHRCSASVTPLLLWPVSSRPVDDMSADLLSCPPP